MLTYPGPFFQLPLSCSCPTISSAVLPQFLSGEAERFAVFTQMHLTFCFGHGLELDQSLGQREGSFFASVEGNSSAIAPRQWLA
jgi:hypothetical protein